MFNSTAMSETILPSQNLESNENLQILTFSDSIFLAHCLAKTASEYSVREKQPKGRNLDKGLFDKCLFEVWKNLQRDQVNTFDALMQTLAYW